MIKKLLLFLSFTICITTSAVSDSLIAPPILRIFIHPEILKYGISHYIDEQYAEVATNTYQNLMWDDGSVTNNDLNAVCKAGHLENDKCSEFKRFIVGGFHESCGKTKGQPNDNCIDDVFYSALTGTQVTMLQADGLAKEYARVRHNQDIFCSTNFRTHNLNDFVKCRTADGQNYYEFKFNSVENYVDLEIDTDMNAAICKIHGVDYKAAHIKVGGEYVGNQCVTSDVKVCSNINKSAAKFALKTDMQDGVCAITKKYNLNMSNLRTAFGIDNKAFIKGYQLSAYAGMRDQLCDYIKANATTQITTCECEYGISRITDYSNALTMILQREDVLTCYANGEPIDFVFDDLNEGNKKIAAAGSQAMDCMVAGGTYAGELCINLDEYQCKLLANANLKNCPFCKQVIYQNGACVLPSGADAENIKKNRNIALIVGGAVFGVVVTVVTGGAGATLVLTGIETIGSAIELGSQIKIDAIADEFLVKSVQCKLKSCAQELIQNNFQHLADSQNDFSALELKAIDSEMARLAKLIPTDSDFWADMALNSLNMADNRSGMFDFSHWTPEQWWRAVGITLQMASVIASVGDWIGKKTKAVVTKLSDSTKVLKSKTDDTLKAIVQIQDDIPLSPKRAELKKKLVEGNKITLSDGEKIQIPNGRMAATVATTDGRLTNITGQTKYGVINMLDDWMMQNGSSVIVQYDKNMKAIYTAGIQDDAMPAIERWLHSNKVPYSKNGNYIKILETNLESVGTFARSADDPMITQLIKEFDDGAVMRALDNATSEEAMERAVSEIMENRETVNIIFKDAIDTNKLDLYALNTRQEYLQIIANDGDLARDALRFDELNTAQKEAFANEILRKYNSGICDGGVCHIDPELVNLSGTQKNGIIQISEPHNLSLDDFMNTLAHENNHFHDEMASGFLNHEQSRLGSAMAGDFTDDINIYNTNLTEHASDVIGRTVGQGFTSELNKMLNASH